jgi:hypothetical protein
MSIFAQKNIDIADFLDLYTIAIYNFFTKYLVNRFYLSF